MATIGRYLATTEMVVAHTAANDLALQTFRQLVTQALQLRAIMDTPLDGAIQHGARRALFHQHEAFFFAAQSLKDVLPDEQGRDWFPWMVLRDHHARGSLGLPGWMQRLIDRNGGVPPETYTNADVMSDAAIAKEKQS